MSSSNHALGSTKDIQEPGHTRANQETHTQIADNSYPPATADHPRANAPDPTTSSPVSKLKHAQGASTTTVHDNASQGRESTTASASSSELASLEIKLRNGLRQFPDFPEKGILFEDIMPLFANHDLHESLIRALELKLSESFGSSRGVDVIVGLEARGFLFGPTLALRIGAKFVPVRKKGKLPGQCEQASYQKEYGADVFEVQSDAIGKGEKVVIVDDIIATGGTAAAAGTLVTKLGGHLLGYLFMMELDFLKGRDKLDASVHTLFAGQKEGTTS